MKSFRQLVNLLEVMTAQQHGADVFSNARRRGMDVESSYQLAQKAEERRKQRFKNIKKFKDSPEANKNLKKALHATVLSKQSSSPLDDLSGVDYTDDKKRLRALIGRNSAFNIPHPSKIDTLANPSTDELEYHWLTGKINFPSVSPITDKTKVDLPMGETDKIPDANLNTLKKVLANSRAAIRQTINKNRG